MIEEDKIIILKSRIKIQIRIFDSKKYGRVLVKYVFASLKSQKKLLALVYCVQNHIMDSVLLKWSSVQWRDYLIVLRPILTECDKGVIVKLSLN